jgi:hypothetical protein
MAKGSPLDSRGLTPPLGEALAVGAALSAEGPQRSGGPALQILAVVVVHSQHSARRDAVQQLRPAPAKVGRPVASRAGLGGYTRRRVAIPPTREERDTEREEAQAVDRDRQHSHVGEDEPDQGQRSETAGERSQPLPA